MGRPRKVWVSAEKEFRSLFVPVNILSPSLSNILPEIGHINLVERAKKMEVEVYFKDGTKMMF